MESLIEFFIDWGYVGLFLSALVAGSVVPFSSEAVMVVLIEMGLNEWGCLAAATAGNTLGGMTCYWIGRAGKREWITRLLRVSDESLTRAERFVAGRGALMAFFVFLPYVGDAIAVVLGLMRSNMALTALSMTLGKAMRYAAILGLFEGIAALF